MDNMDIKTAYCVMQAASGIEVGDTVKVLREFRHNEMGFGSDTCQSYGWDSFVEKKKMQGKEFIVIEIGHNFVKLRLPEHPYTPIFPFFALEIVKKAKSEKMLNIKGNMWSEATIAEALRKHAE
ncbi:hypothetical protein LCGC14_2037560 [marine sediment metagenome]|uniref:Uncharacterized protein n=1 Tax=marine sediment metagenome TaxID=412755 RepID=A0A0F9H6A0_9ZZZZ